MENTPKLPEHGKHLLLKGKGKKTIWKIYRHPDRVLDNLAIVEKTVNKGKPDKKWIVAKDVSDWVISLIEHGYTCVIDTNE